MAHRVTLIAGLHATPGTLMPWEKQSIDLAVNLKTVGCRHFKVQQNLDGFSDEASIRFLKKDIVSGWVMYDAKVKDAASTMARYIARLKTYKVDQVTIWIDESGLPEFEKLAHDNKELIPHLCGVIELTTTDKQVTKDVHGCSRETFMKRQAVAAAKFGMRNFICAIPDALMLRKELALKVPRNQEEIDKGQKIEERIKLYCPGLRGEDEPAGGQILTGTPQEARSALVDFAISERAIADVSDPRYAYTGLREKLYA